MASKDALAIRREAAFARIAAAAGVEPPAANRDPDVTLTQFVEWAADVICGAGVEETEAPADETPELTPEEAALATAKAEAGYDQMTGAEKGAWTRAYKKSLEEAAQETEDEPEATEDEPYEAEAVAEIDAQTDDSGEVEQA